MVLADVSSKVNGDPNFVLQKHHLDYMLNDNFRKPCLLIFKFGWSKFFYNRELYLGIQPNGTLNFPGESSVVFFEFVTNLAISNTEREMPSSTLNKLTLKYLHSFQLKNRIIEIGLAS